jgi:hypothetical protein
VHFLAGYLFTVQVLYNVWVKCILPLLIAAYLLPLSKHITCLLYCKEGVLVHICVQQNVLLLKATQ